jgi:hypothetical protein
MPGTIWSLPNFAGELFTADAINTPFLSMIGGLTGGGKTTENFEFPTSSEYAFPAAAQPNITETASLTAPVIGMPNVPPQQNENFVRTQVTNVTQIFQESILLSYVKLSNMGRMSGLNTAGQVNNVADELAWQQEQKLKKIARDVEFSFIQGVYNLAANQNQANRTRGMVAACALNGGTVQNGQGNQLSLPLMQALFLSMFNAGASFSNLVLYVGGALKQRISALYGFAPTDRNVGGVNIEQIETDFGPIGIVLSRFAPANTVLAIEVSVCAPVFQPVPDKGVLFYEPLSKTGASESGQIFGQIGLDHGPAFMHGVLSNVTA